MSNIKQIFRVVDIPSMQFNGILYKEGQDIELYANADIKKANGIKFLVSLSKLKEEQEKARKEAEEMVSKKENALVLLEAAEKEIKELKRKQLGSDTARLELAEKEHKDELEKKDVNILKLKDEVEALKVKLIKATK